MHSRWTLNITRSTLFTHQPPSTTVVCPFETFPIFASFVSLSHSASSLRFINILPSIDDRWIRRNITCICFQEGSQTPTYVSCSSYGWQYIHTMRVSIIRSLRLRYFGGNRVRHIAWRIFASRITRTKLCGFVRDAMQHAASLCLWARVGVGLGTGGFVWICKCSRVELTNSQMHALFAQLLCLVRLALSLFASSPLPKLRINIELRFDAPVLSIIFAKGFCVPLCRLYWFRSIIVFQYLYLCYENCKVVFNFLLYFFRLAVSYLPTLSWI